MGDPVLAVTSTGGHLAELHQLLPRMVDPGTPVEWVTFDTAQSRSLLDGLPVTYIGHVRTRHLLPALRNVPPAFRILRRRRYRAVVGCGAAALTFLPVARALGIPAHFLEAATRTAGPSVTGRLLGAVPGVHRYTQHEGWARDRWLHRGSVFDGFAAEPGPATPRLDRVVVTLGMNPYPFRRVLERLLDVLPASAEVLWQTGRTPVDRLALEARASLPALELDRAMAAADVVVAHAGTGSALAALAAGRIPVVVPRRHALGEQVDDHQLELADELAARGLAVVSTVEDLDAATLLRAGALRAVRRGAGVPFPLAP